MNLSTPAPIPGREGRLAAARHKPRSMRELRRVARGPAPKPPAPARFVAPDVSGPAPWFATLPVS